MLKFQFFCILFASAITVNAQKVTISVKDSVANQRIHNYKVLLQYDAGEEVLEPNINGEVIFKVLNKRNIIFKTLSVGYQDYASIIFNDLKIDTTVCVFLSKKVYQIEEVVIDMPRIKNKNGKITFYPPKTEFNKTLSSLDILPSIPNMSFRNGTLLFRNEKNILILIDGFGENASHEDQLRLIQNIPISNIRRIEIDYRPSLRYGNNIVAVLNIITNKDQGFSIVKFNNTIQALNNSGIESPLFSNEISGDVKFRYRKNNIHILLRNVKKRSSSKELENITYENVETNGSTFIKNVQRNFYPSLVVDREFSKRSSLKLNFSYSSQNTNLNGGSEFIEKNMSNVIAMGVLDKVSLKKSRYVLSPQIKLLLDTTSNKAIYVNGTLAKIVDEENNNFSTEGINRLSSMKARTTVSYIDLIGEKLFKLFNASFDIGYKFNLLKNNTAQGGDFLYREAQNSVFISSNIELGKVIFKGDIRMENIASNITSSDTSIKGDALNFFPKITLDYPIGEHNIAIGYNKEFLRFSSLSLNPNIRYEGYYNGSTGNMYLKPRITNHFYVMANINNHYLSINYKNHKDHRIFIPLNDQYPYVRQPISFSYFNQIYLTYDIDVNFSKKLKTNFGMYYYWNIFDDKSHNISKEIYKNISIDLNTTYIKGKNRFELAFSYVSPSETLFARMGPVVYNTISCNRLLFKDNLNISIGANDFLGLTKENYLYDHPIFLRENTYKNNQRNFFINFIYRFPLGDKVRNSKYRTELKDEIRI